MSKALPLKPNVKIGDAAKILGVSIDTLRRWEKKGKLEAVRTPGGTRLYNVKALQKIIGVPVKPRPTPSLPTSELLKKATQKISPLQPVATEPVVFSPVIPNSFRDLPSRHPLLDQMLKRVQHDIKQLFPLPIPPKNLLYMGGISFTVAAVATGLFLLYRPFLQQAPKSKEAAVLSQVVGKDGLREVLAASASAGILEINTNVEIGGTLNGLNLIATSGSTLNVLSDVTLDQDVSTTSSPTFESITLSNAVNQIGGNTITFPSATTTLVGTDTKDTLTNKTMSGSSNTFTDIPNSALTNHKVTITAGTNLTGGGAVELGKSITISAKDSPSFSGQVLLSDGTASAPGLAFANDTNTGLYRIGADNISLITGGTAGQGITIDASGNVGLNTITPTTKLHVVGTGNITGAVTIGGTLGVTGATTLSSTLAINGNTTIGDASGDTITFNADAWTLSNDTNVTLSGGVNGLSFDTTTLSIDASNDRVGIGTTSPNQALEVIGSGRFSSTLQLADGTNASPAYTFTNDTNTGLYRIDTDRISFVTGGASRLSINSSGNVGIGTTDPATALEVIGAGTISDDLAVNGGDITTSATTFNLINATATTINFGGAATSIIAGATNGAFDIRGNLGIGTSSPGARLAVAGGGLIGYTGTEAAPVNGLAVSGNVGIGTTSPNYKLEIVGNTNITGNLTVGGTTSPASAILLSDGSSSTPALSFASDTDTGLYRASSDNMRLVTGGMDRITINSAGNVGIGVTSPATAFHVGGITTVNNKILAGAGSLDIGSSAIRFGTGYFDTVDATNLAGTVTGGSTSNASWTINSDNATNDAEDASLAFERGTGADTVPNAVLGWDSSTHTTTNGKEFDLNSRLHITGTIRSYSGILLEGFENDITTATNEHLAIMPQGTGNVGIGTTGPGSTLQINGNTVIGFGQNTTAAPSNGLAVSGNVGIGSSSPSYKLEVVGTSHFTGNSTFDGVLQLADGTNAAPSLTFLNDTNTGLYRIDTDRMSFVTGGASALTINSAGNVGIGTTNPSALFAVGTSTLTATVGGNVGIGTSTPNVALQLVGATALGWAGAPVITAPTSGLAVNGNVGIGTTVAGASLQVNGNVVIGYSSASTAGPTNGLAVLGNVGIGTTSPQYNLHVVGTTNISGTTTFNGTLQLADGSLTAPSLAFTNDTDTGLFRFGSNGLALTTGGSGVNLLSLNSSGNVGIGTTGPAQALEVRGTARIGSNLTNYIEIAGAAAGSATTITSGPGAVALTLTAGTSGNSDLTLSGSSNTYATFNAESLTIPTTGADRGIAITASGTNADIELRTGGGNGVIYQALRSTDNTAFFMVYRNTGDLLLQVLNNGRLRSDVADPATVTNWSVSAESIFRDFGSTIPGTLTITSGFSGQRFNAFGAPTITAASALTVTNAATVYIAGAPIAAGSATITNSAALVIASGNVGIGYTAPVQTLHVQGTEYISGNLGVGTSSPGAKLSVAGGGLIGYTGTQVAPSNGLAILGNVGIGTTSPAYNLQVVGTTNITGASTFGGALQLADGTNSAPSLTFANDTNTGLYRIDTDRMSLVTGGASALTINSSGNVGIGNTNPGGSLIVNSGNVGIGTNSPVALLDVRGTVLINQTSIISDKVLDVAGEAQIDNYLHIGTNAENFTNTQSALEIQHNYNISLGAHSVGIFSNPTRISASNAGINHAGVVSNAAVNVAGTVSNTMAYWAGNSTVAGGATITNNYGLYVDNQTSGTNDFGVFVAGADTAAGYFGGNVGIGNSSPGASLQIHGNGVIGYGVNSVAGPSNGLAVLGNVGIGTTSPQYNLHVVGTTNITGASTFGDALQLADGTNATPSLTFVNDTNTGLYRIDTDRMTFVTGGLDRMTINSSGNLGIGTTNPTGVLHVVGGAGTAAPITLTAGSATGSTTGGAINLDGGVGGGTGGAVNLTGGTSGGGAAAGTGGAIVLGGGTAGTSVAGAAISITAGTGSNNGGATGGAVTIAGGLGGGGNSNGGAVIINGGAAGGAGSNVGGAITITSGAGLGSQTSGITTVTTGAPGTTGASGALNLTTGAGGSISGASGALTLATGTTTSGRTGDLTLRSGAATGGNAGDIFFQTNGTNLRMTVAYGGNVGIGTSTPGATLQIAGNSVIGFGAAPSVTAPTNGLAVGGNVGIGNSNPLQRFHVNQTETTSFVVASSGNVGIGTSSPTAALSFGSTSTINTLSGNLTLQTGIGSGAGAGGTLALTGGAGGATGAGGPINLTSGAGGGTSGASGTITIQPGSVTSGAGGALQILGRDGVAAVGSTITITAGASGVGGVYEGGDVNITAGGGGGTNGGGGDVNLTGGSSGGGGAGGDVTLLGGSGGTSSREGGVITITGGTPGSASNGGAITLTSGPGGSSSGNSGALTLATGTTNSGSTGSLTLRSGAATGGTAGSIIFQTNGTNERARFDAAGNLGIGYASSLGGALVVSGNVGIGTSTPGSALQIVGAGVIGFGGAPFAAPSQGLVVSGNVGVGTSSPIARLHVEGQCVTGDTKLRRRRRRKGKNGEWIEDWEDVRIDEIQPGDEILTLDEKTGKFVVQKVEKLMDMGVQTVFELTTENGNKIKTTSNHPYLVQGQVVDNWVKVDQLKKGMRIATLGGKSQQTIDFAFVDETGIFEGKTQTHMGIGMLKVDKNFSIINQELRNILLECVNKLEEDEKHFEFKFTYITENSLPFYHKLLDVLEKYQDDWDFTFALQKKSHTGFWKQYFYLTHTLLRSSTSRSTVLADYLNRPKSSKNVLEDLVKLSTVENVLQIESQGSVFLQLADVMLGAIGFMVRNGKDEYNKQIAQRVIKILEKKERAGVSPSLCRPGNGWSSSATNKQTISHLIKTVKNKKDGYKVTLYRLSAGVAAKDSFVKWDKIISIKKVGQEQTYDIQVANTHNFVGNGIVAHNTYISGNLGIGTSSPGARLAVAGGGLIGYLGTEVAPTNGLAVFGNVGIGTTSPAYNLQVVGTTNITGASTFGGALQLADGTNAAPSLTFANDTNTGLFRFGDNGLALTTGGSGTSLLSLNSAGNVGIGTTNPTGILHVVGGAGTGAPITLTAGQGSATGTGGAITLTSGAGGGTSGASGAITLQVGTPVSGNAGALQILGAAGVASNNVGSTITLTAGNSAGTGVGGAVNITAGGANNGISGAVTITGGTSWNSQGTGGEAKMTGGLANGSFNGGAITLAGGATGAASGTARGGAASLTSGATTAGSTGASGALTLSTGAAANNTGGTAGGASGAVILRSTDGGTSATGNGGDSGTLSISTGNGGAVTTSTGTGGAGGTLSITGGTGGGTNAVTGGAGAAVNITAGTGGAGSTTGGAGGALTFVTGNAGSGGNVNGGALTLRTGTATGTGLAGSIIFQTNGTNERMRIDNAGNVGIGTSTPGSALQIVGAGVIGFGAAPFTAPSQGLVVSGNVGVGTSSPIAKLHVEGQCVTGDTKLRRRRRRRKSEARNSKSETDEWIWEDVRIDEIQPGDEILTLDEETGKFVVQKVEKLMDMGVKEIYTLTTATGKTIRTTANHPYLVAKEKKQAKIAVFIDAANFEINLRVLGRFAHYKTMLSQLKDAGQPVFLGYYGPRFGGVHGEKQKKFFAFLKGLGFHIITKDIKVIKQRKKPDLHKANFDVEIAYDARHLLHDYDTAVIFSGDSDFSYLVSKLQREDKKVIIVSSANTVSRELKTKADVFLDLGHLAFAQEKTPSIKGRGSHGSDTIEVKTSLADILPFVNSGHWTKVSALQKGQMIATHGTNGKPVFERIISIRKTKAEQVYDIQVANTHNFVGNGIVAHNTYISGNLGVGTSSPGAKLSVAGGGLIGYTGTQNLSSGTDLAVFGNVGIGTTSPNAKLEVVGGILAANGSAASPTYSFSNDSDTGIYRSAENAFILVSGGNNTFRVDSSGITGSASGARFNASNDTIAYTFSGATGIGMDQYGSSHLQFYTNSTVGMLLSSTGNVGIGTGNGATLPYAKLQLQGTGTGTGVNLLTTSSAGAFGLAVLDNGNVGIGTTGPTQKLDISGSARISGSGDIFLAIDSIIHSPYLGFRKNGVSKWSLITERDTPAFGMAANDFGIYNDNLSANAIVIATATSNVGIGYNSNLNTKLSINGNVGIGTTSAGASIQINGNGVIGYGSASVAAPTNGLAVFGNVGIGTTSPTYNLQVVGTANITGALTVGGATSFAGSLSPSIDDTYDLGTSALRWRDLYLGPSSLNLVSTAAETTTARNWKIGIEENGSAEGNLRFALTGSPDALNINPSGNVGIGTTSPGAKLHLLSSSEQLRVALSSTVYTTFTQNSARLIITANGSTAGTNINSSNAGGTALALDIGNIAGGSGADSVVFGLSPDTNQVTSFMRITAGKDAANDWATTSNRSGYMAFSTPLSNTVSERMRITSGGNIGIGTSIPNSTLQVNGNATIGFGNATVGTGPTNGLAVFGNVGIGTSSPAYNLQVVGTTNITGTSTFGGALQLADGTNAAPSLTFANDTNTGLYRIDTDRMSFVTGGISRATIDNSGNVGIGTTGPTSKLAVIGSTTLGGAATDTITLTGSLNSNVNFLDASTGTAYTITGSDATGTNAAGGNLTLISGAGTGSGLGGTLTLAAGTSGTGSAGSVLLRGGEDTGSVNGGGITLRGGDGGTTNTEGGDVTIRGGNANGGAGDGGDVTVTGGAAGTTTNGGAITITTGAGGSSSGPSGALTLATGTTSSGRTGDLTLRTGAATGGNAGDIFFQTNGTNLRMTVAYGGNVGIGTSTPGATLQIAGNSVIGFGAAPAVTGPSNGLAVGGNLGIGNSNPLQRFHVNQSETTSFVVASSGNVGIGTSSPTAALSFGSTSTINTLAAGNLTLQTGAGSGAGAGGTLALTGGAGGATGAGGAITLTSGAGGSTSGASGAVTIGSGTTTSGNSGAVILESASTSGNSNTSGNLTIRTGGATSGSDKSSGSLSISTGDPNGDGNAGPITITAGGAGGAATGDPADITITAGAAGNGAADAGDVILVGGDQSGTTSSRAGGRVSLTGGSGNDAGTGGAVVLTGGDGSLTGAGGAITLTTGAGGSSSGASGALTLASGTTTSGRTGDLTLRSGVATGGLAGDISFQTNGSNIRMTVMGAGNIGIGTSTPGATLQIAGNSVIGFGAAPAVTGPSNGLAVGGNIGVGVTNPAAKLEVLGNLLFTSGATRTISVADQGSSNTAGSQLSVTGAAGNGSGAGGALALTAGAGGATGIGGAVTITAGAGGSSSGAGGALTITAGNATGTNSNGGQLSLVGGRANHTGTTPDLLITGGAGPTSGGGADETGGNVLIQGGGARIGGGGSKGGDVQLLGGGGDGSGAGNAGGDVILTGGSPNTGAGAGGAISITTGAGGSTSGASGALTLASGTTSSGRTGDLTLRSGAATGGNAGDIFFQTNGTNLRMTVAYGGNVGIGTSTPGATLQIAGNQVIGYGGAPTAGPSNGLAVFGNMGVGTTSPNYKLEVIGSINVTGDIFKNGTAYNNPDYAFEQWATGQIALNADKPGASTYTGILSLEDTEAFVRQNFQLPRVASATGIFERGDILLEKVEETYIHLFDLNRKIASNSAQLSDLSAALTTQTINLGSFSIASSSAGLTISSAGQNLLALDALGNMKLAGTITSEAGAFDVAEDYPATDESIEAGDVVAISETVEGNIEKSSTPYQNGIIGVISTKAGLHLGGEDGRPVALAGRVPVKVTTESGEIKAGDYLTSSSIPGLAMKMTRAGTSIGKALESFSCPTSDICQGTVLTFINVGWHDPTVYFTAGGLQQLAPDATPSLVSLPLDTEIASESAIASPSAQNTTYDIPNTNLSEDPLFKDLLSRIDLLSSRLDALQRVVVGTESAELIPASSSAELLAAIEDVQLNASGSAQLTGTLTVAGRTTLNDVGITGTLNAGVLSIDGIEGSLNTLAGDLKLQNLALGGIDILAGKIKIDTKGNIVSEGTITAKEVEAEKITTQKLVITEPVATQSAVLSASASATASPSAVLSASAGTVTIKAGQTSIDVETSALTVKSLVFVTPDKPIATSGKVKDATTVTISIPTPTPEDIKVNWWIIN